MPLKSRLFRGDSKLEAAAVSDPAHITIGAKGDHVLVLDGAYGHETAAAVLAYEQKRDIINRIYQTKADNIVGKMTMAALDDEMKKKESDPVVHYEPRYFMAPSPPKEGGAGNNLTPSPATIR
jgi:hypothetical protein